MLKGNNFKGDSPQKEITPKGNNFKRKNFKG